MKNKNTQEKYKPSEGEEFISEYLEKKSLDFDSQHRKKLEHDYADYRDIDFYIPKYKVYLEFLGKWNSGGKPKYIQKMQVYEKNNLPCIYIYPDNLGILDFIFKKRLKKVLKQHNMKWELFKFNIQEIQDKYLLGILLIGAFIYLASPWYMKLVGVLFLCIHFYNIFKDIFLNNC